MEKLLDLPASTRLSTHVIRILGQNPGKFTLQGTNTYLIGTHPPFVLVDTGEGRTEYLIHLEKVLLENIGNEDTQLVSDIIVTHRHADHYGGLADVLNLLKKIHDSHSSISSSYKPPRIQIYPVIESATSSHQNESVSDESHQSNFEDIISKLPKELLTLSPDGRPMHFLADNQVLQASDTKLTVFHTPGHTVDSICLLLSDTTNKTEGEDVLFSADTVLGQGTAVFTDLAAYISSLRRLLSLKAKASDPQYVFTKIYPGHGPVVVDGPSLILQYIAHRLEREAQIVEVLSSPSPTPADPPQWTIWSIVKLLYKDYPENLWPAAARGIGLHLRKLESDQRARHLSGEGVEELWSLIPDKSVEATNAKL